MSVLLYVCQLVGSVLFSATLESKLFTNKTLATF